MEQRNTVVHRACCARAEVHQHCCAGIDVVSGDVLELYMRFRAKQQGMACNDWNEMLDVTIPKLKDRRDLRTMHKPTRLAYVMALVGSMRHPALASRAVAAVLVDHWCHDVPCESLQKDALRHSAVASLAAKLSSVTSTKSIAKQLRKGIADALNGVDLATVSVFPCWNRDSCILFAGGPNKIQQEIKDLARACLRAIGVEGARAEFNEYVTEMKLDTFVAGFLDWGRAQLERLPASYVDRAMTGVDQARVSRTSSPLEVDLSSRARLKAGEGVHNVNDVDGDKVSSSDGSRSPLPQNPERLASDSTLPAGRSSNVGFDSPRRTDEAHSSPSPLSSSSLSALPQFTSKRKRRGATLRTAPGTESITVSRTALTATPSSQAMKTKATAFFRKETPSRSGADSPPYNFRPTIITRDGFWPIFRSVLATPSTTNNSNLTKSSPDGCYGVQGHGGDRSAASPGDRSPTTDRDEHSSSDSNGRENDHDAAAGHEEGEGDDRDAEAEAEAEAEPRLRSSDGKRAVSTAQSAKASRSAVKQTKAKTGHRGCARRRVRNQGELSEMEQVIYFKKEFKDSFEEVTKWQRGVIVSNRKDGTYDIFLASGSTARVIRRSELMALQEALSSPSLYDCPRSILRAPEVVAPPDGDPGFATVGTAVAPAERHSRSTRSPYGPLHSPLASKRKLFDVQAGVKCGRRRSSSPVQREEVTELESRELKSKESESKESEFMDSRSKELRSKAMESGLRESEMTGSESEESNSKELESKEPSKKSESKGLKSKNSKSKKSRLKAIEPEPKESLPKGSKSKRSKSKDSKSKESEPNYAKSKKSKSKKVRSKAMESKELRLEAMESKEWELNEAKLKEPESHESELREPESKESDSGQSELKQSEWKNSNSKDSKAMESDSGGSEMEEPESKELESRESEVKGWEPGKSELEEAESKELNSKVMESDSGESEFESEESNSKKVESKESESKGPGSEEKSKESASKRSESEEAEWNERRKSSDPSDNGVALTDGDCRARARVVRATRHAANKESPAVPAKSADEARRHVLREPKGNSEKIADKKAKKKAKKIAQRRAKAERKRTLRETQATRNKESPASKLAAAAPEVPGSLGDSRGPAGAAALATSRAIPHRDIDAAGRDVARNGKGGGKKRPREDRKMDRSKAVDSGDVPGSLPVDSDGDQGRDSTCNDRAETADGGGVERGGAFDAPPDSEIAAHTTMVGGCCIVGGSDNSSSDEEMSRKRRPKRRKAR